MKKVILFLAIILSIGMNNNAKAIAVEIAVDGSCLGCGISEGAYITVIVIICSEGSRCFRFRSPGAIGPWDLTTYGDCDCLAGGGGGIGSESDIKAIESNQKNIYKGFGEFKGVKTNFISTGTREIKMQIEKPVIH